MNRRVYRICLIMIIMAAVLSGFFYYRFTQKEEVVPSEGIFVWQEGTSWDRYMPYGNNNEIVLGDICMPCGNINEMAGCEFV